MKRAALPALALALVTGAALAGPLDPPAGPVAPTMKTLDQVEPRIVINAENTPGDANSLYRISEPGSYYLTGNITGQAGLHGIEIGARGVTIDLNGFTLQGVPGSLDGIASAFLQYNVTIRNGHVSGWGEDGIDLGESGVVGRASLIEGIHAHENGGRGIYAGYHAIVRNCAAEYNGSHGIQAFGRVTVQASAASRNGGNGFELAEDSVIVDSFASENGGHGINAPVNGVVTNCVADSNTLDGIRGLNTTVVSGCAARENGGNGILVTTGSTVRACVAEGNDFAGVYAATNCLVLNCNVTNNAIAGVRVFDTDTRVEGNNAADNGTGYLIESDGNILLRNTASGNATNWQVVANNKGLVVFAPNAPAINGDTGGASPGTTNPHANFTY